MALPKKAIRANAIFRRFYGVCVAGSKVQIKHLFRYIGGKMHIHYLFYDEYYKWRAQADNNLDFQEFDKCLSMLLHLAKH